ncbi:hypothetical protein ACRQ4C_14790 [Curtobacterium sp. SP.BCp]|uniref:hypothetical protein n=1 Tax=Curtobacterium sp. SP.BCp TaxID=3435230 RepID=UPI003F73EEC8
MDVMYLITSAIWALVLIIVVVMTTLVVKFVQPLRRAREDREGVTDSRVRAELRSEGFTAEEAEQALRDTES